MLSRVIARRVTQLRCFEIDIEEIELENSPCILERGSTVKTMEGGGGDRPLYEIMEREFRKKTMEMESRMFAPLAPT